MTRIAISLIRVYQVVLSPILRMLAGGVGGCRFSLSCSEYAIITIRRNGVLLSFPLIFSRILSCQPFNKRAV